MLLSRGKVKKAGKTEENRIKYADRNGLVLVAVLWIVVVLTVIAAAVRRNAGLDRRVCLTRMETVRCRWACRAGVETAIAVLNEDFRASDGLTDLWSENDEDFNDIELEKCWFTVRVVDEAGKLNVNTVTREQLLGLEYMTEEIADAIIDWRDEDEASSPLGVEGGYYQNLPYGYTIRNGPFKTIRELLLVRGVSRELLYGEDTNFNGRLDYNERDGDASPPADDADDELDAGWIAHLTCYSYDKNKDAYANDRVNINKADENELERSLEIKKSYAKWIVDNRPKDGYKSIADLISERSPREAKKGSEGDSGEASPLDLQTFSAIADKITVKEDDRILGRVNINTAPRDVLAALLGSDESAYRLADEIIAYREGLAYEMESIAELLNVQSMKVGIFKEIAEHITTRSDVFTVRCFATAGRGDLPGAAMQAEAVADRGSRPCKVLYWYQGANN